MALGEPARSQRNLLLSNACDAASRSLNDFVIDVLFISVLGASALQMGLLNALGSAAFIFAALPAGVLIDRFRPLRILRIGLGAKIFLTVLLLALAATQTLTIGLGLVLATLMGVSNVFSETSQVSAVPSLSSAKAEDRHASITSLIARLAAADQSLTIIIPAAAGVGIVLLGAPALLGLAVALGLCAFGLTWAIRVTPAPAPFPDELERPTEKFMVSVLAGFRFVARQRQLLALTVIVMFSNAGLAIGSAVEGVFILSYLDLGIAWFGIITGIGGAGGLLGAALAPKVAARFSSLQIIVSTALIQALLAGMVFAAAFTSPVVSLVLLATQALLWGIAVIAFNVSTAAWAVSITPEPLLGRVTSARRTLTFGVVPLGSLLGGALGSGIGIPPVLALWSALTLVGLVIFYLISRSPTRVSR